MKSRIKGALSVLLMLIVCSSQASANLLLDWLFNNNGSITFNGSYSQKNRGKKIGPWKVTAGSVDLVHGYWEKSPAGGNSIDMDGGSPGTITQSIATQKDVAYTLSFAVSGNYRAGSSVKVVQASIAGTTKQFNISRPAGWALQNMQWVQVSMPFVGTGKTETLQFKSKSRSGSAGAVIADAKIVETVSAPKSLDTVNVPLPKDIDNFVKNKDAAILLGKSLFWDMQVGSDAKTACASCHFHAGGDSRITHQLNPGAPGSAFGPQNDHQRQLNELAVAAFRGPNKTLKKGDFPFHKLAHPNSSRGSDNSVVRDTPEVAGSQGVVKRDFVAINEGNPVDDGNLVADPVFNIDGANARQVTGRNAPTMINAVFFDRTFWDGRARNKFNGVNPFGDLDPDARVWLMEKSNTFEDKLAEVMRQNPWLKPYERIFRKYNYLVRWFLGSGFSGVESIKKVRILLENASLASQAVGPALSDVEMSWNGRSFPELGRKMFSLQPLGLQPVHKDDSVLGSYANEGGLGLKSDVSYARLVREAFHEKWWGADSPTPEGFTQMEANFSLFWGLAINMYESTLVSDESPFDQYARGDHGAMSDLAKRGLDIFLNEGKCINCHGGSEFAGATISDLNGGDEDGDGVIEFMMMQQGPQAFYDGGFYNIGVRPTLEDLGVGAAHPAFGPLSYTRQRQNGRDIGQDVRVRANDRVAVDGAFKASSMRNIELTGPYMHNGGMKSLTEVVQFYTRGADFFKENIDDLDPDVHGISELQDNPEDIAAVVAFLKALTDDRVRYERAPFDHPGLVLPHGHSGVENGVALDVPLVIEPVGREGGAPLKPFEDLLAE